MSAVAVCFDSVDSVRRGTATLLMRLLWRSPGDSTTLTFVIVPPLITTCTWNGPHGSATSDPVQVPSAYLAVERVDELDVEPEPELDVEPELDDDVDPPVEALADTGSVASPPVVRKARTSADPAPVRATAAIDLMVLRRMG